MISRDDVIATVRGFLAENHGEVVARAKDDESLFDLGVLDSLGIVSMVMFLEDRFGVAFHYDDLNEDNMRSLGAIAALVSRYRAAERDGSAR